MWRPATLPPKSADVCAVIQILRLHRVARGSKSIDPVARHVKDTHEKLLENCASTLQSKGGKTCVGLPQLSPEQNRVQIIQMRLPIKQFESRVHHHLLLRASNPRRPISNLRAPATLYTLHPANLLYPCRQGRKSFGFHSGKFAGLDHVMSDHYLAAGREVPEGAERSRADKEEDPILQVHLVTTAKQGIDLRY